MANQKKTPTKRQPVGMQNYGSIDPDFSRRVMDCNLKVSLIRDDKPKTPDEMKETILKYFEICRQYALPPTVERITDLQLTIIETRFWKSKREIFPNNLWAS